ncbi:DUF1569 domain-containing protein [uncultured Gimesia sp.]|uniref:DUF1569 domain-containing protein n=1 Tax=uncultured Gimesia sp. TaxID=1678688 RepID=UPI0026202761|nr:DUF1569 domain-containing protein [uncultured Gimesia sp.]
MSTKTANRRTLSYASLQEVVEDARRLTEAEAPTTGGWTKGQIFEHLARTMDSSLDGFAFTFPWPIRIMGQYFFKPRIFKNGMSPGFKLKGASKQALAPDPLADREALEHLTKSIQRLEAEPQRAFSPVFGQMTCEEWDKLHRRHSELHMSFIAEP